MLRSHQSVLKCLIVLLAVILPGVAVFFTGSRTNAWQGNAPCNPSSEPAIEEAAIKRSKAITWVNIAETVNLRAKGKDGDKNAQCEIAYDYIDLAATTWTCATEEYLSRTTGSDVTFSPTTAGDSDIVVTATIKDIAGGATDDADVEQSKTFKAYKVGCKLAINPSSAQTQEGTVWQNDDETELTLWTLSVGGSDTITANPGNQSVEQGAGCTADWIPLIFPGSAALDSAGTIDTRIKHFQEGGLRARVQDSDTEESPFTPDSVSVALGVGAGINASIGFTWEPQANTTSATAGAGVSFTSDHLSAIPNEAVEKIEISSDSVDSNWRDLPADYSQTATFYAASTGIVSRAKAVWKYGLKTRGANDDFTWAEAKTGTADSSSLKFNFRIDARPTYAPSTDADADVGY